MANIDISTVFPGWKVVRVLGKGGFGAVYEIERDRLGKVEKAAVKVMNIPPDPEAIHEMQSEGYDEVSIKARIRSELDSFAKEYDYMRSLTHTNIVSSDDLEYRENPDGMGYTLFMKMELLTPMLDAIKKFGNDEAVAQGVARDICSALELCESRNIVHRDIKPHNIFINKYNEFKLGDFGISREMNHYTNATRAGTGKYMAPEVFNNQSYGPNVDIYSLGLVLYWVLNERRLPFLPLPPTVPNVSQEEEAIARRLRGEKLPPPKKGSPELKRIVLKACEPDKSKRYQHASEMLADLNSMGSKKAPASQDTTYEETISDDTTVGGKTFSGSTFNGYDENDSTAGGTVRGKTSFRAEQSTEKTMGNEWDDSGETMAQPRRKASQVNTVDDKTVGAQTFKEKPASTGNKDSDFADNNNQNENTPEKDKKNTVLGILIIILVPIAICVILFFVAGPSGAFMGAYISVMIFCFLCGKTKIAVGLLIVLIVVGILVAL